MFSKLSGCISSSTRSLRFRIAWSAILAVACSSLVADTIIYVTTARQVRERTEASLIRTNHLLAFAGEHWRQDIFKSLELLGLNTSFRNLDPMEMADVLKSLSTRYPSRRISVWSPDGRLLVGDALGQKDGRNLHVLANPAFQEALRGRRTLQVLAATASSNACVFAATPIEPLTPEAAATTRGGTPKAILTFCLPFFLAEDDKSLSADIEKTDDPQKGIRNPDVISMQTGDYSGSEFMMVRNNGYVIFPLTSVNDWISGQSPTAIRKGPWGPFVNFALSQQPDNHGIEVKAKGKRFIVVKRWLPDHRWVVLSIVNRDTAFRGLNAALENLRRLQLATLAVVALVLYRVSGGIVKPIRTASTAIRRISRGDFQVQIVDERRDELGDLYADINATGALLSSYVTAEKSHAAAEQQIATAQQIQQSFLIKRLPESEWFDLAANFLPAYEIGADWYDSLRVGRFLYVIVADVCDKGVPSALFMSVFRSLLRSNILTEARETAVDQPVDLPLVVTLVNEYMATNHGDTCMFATIFVASYDTESGQLRYVNAGHEPPLVLRGLASDASLELLPQTGPAVGLFPGAQFQGGESTLAPGDLLFTFTDGLTDARSPSQEGWGMERLQDFLLQLQPEDRQPDAVLQEVLAVIRRHQGDADRFDDLTVLTLRIKPAHPPAALPAAPSPA